METKINFMMTIMAIKNILNIKIDKENIVINNININPTLNNINRQDKLQKNNRERKIIHKIRNFNSINKAKRNKVEDK
jgi:hypothetical protein